MSNTEVKNVNVYNLKESVIACRNAMRIEIPEYTDEEFVKSLPRAIKLCKASDDAKDVKCHENFLKGITVTFDLTYTQYITKQLQRYLHLTYVSSTSMMHKLTLMRVDDCCNRYVTKTQVDEAQWWVDVYNQLEKQKAERYWFPLRDGTTIEAVGHSNVMYYAFMMCISNCPMGFTLFTHVTTNYMCLKNIYKQRRNHKLKEDYAPIIKMIKELPYSKEFITGA